MEKVIIINVDAYNYVIGLNEFLGKLRRLVFLS